MGTPDVGAVLLGCCHSWLRDEWRFRGATASSRRPLPSRRSATLQRIAAPAQPFPRSTGDAHGPRGPTSTAALPEIESSGHPSKTKQGPRGLRGPCFMCSLDFGQCLPIRAAFAVIAPKLSPASAASLGNNPRLNLRPLGTLQHTALAIQLRSKNEFRR